jgi:hypothetical protein
MKSIKKTKSQLFQELKSFQGFNIMKHKAVQEADNLRELKANLAYYYSKYECLSRQTGDIILGFDDKAKFFLGERYFVSNKVCKIHIEKLRAIASFMGYEIEKLTW